MHLHILQLILRVMKTQAVDTLDKKSVNTIQTGIYF